MFDEIKEWLKQPYSDGMSVGGWFIFLGFVGVVSFAWAKIIKETISKFEG